MTGYRPFYNAATGEWIEFLTTAMDSDGRLVPFSWRSVPGGVITEHIHPHQEERFIITAGEVRLHPRREGTRGQSAGDTIVVPAGVPHAEGNPGPGEVEALVELRPALRSKEFHEAVAGLVADGRTTPGARREIHSGSGRPSGISGTKAVSRCHPLHCRIWSFQALWVAARALGVRSYYTRWDTSIDQADELPEP